MSHIFSFSRYQTKFAIKLLFKQFDLFYIHPLGIKNASLELAGKKIVFLYWYCSLDAVKPQHEKETAKSVFIRKEE